jgi:hypothetical protein
MTYYRTRSQHSNYIEGRLKPRIYENILQWQ